MRKRFLLFVLIAIFFLTVFAAYKAAPFSSTTLKDGVLSLYPQTGAINAVTAVTFDFRIFDTLFESFLLLVSIMGLSQFLRLEHTERIHVEAETDDGYRHSPIARSVLHFLLPILIIFGLTVTAFGFNSPGGGFQGGSILAAIVMVSYLTKSSVHGSILFYTAFEEWLYICFLVLVGGYFICYASASLYIRTAYMILCNFIICFEVNMGLIIIFLRLIGQSQHRTSGDAYE